MPEKKSEIGALVTMCAERARVNQLTNQQLADELLNTVWANLDITTTASSLIDEAIERLQAMNQTHIEY